MKGIINSKNVKMVGNVNAIGQVDQEYDPTSENAQSGIAVAEAVEDKVDKVAGKGLSTYDYDTAEKALVAGSEQTAHKTTSISSTSTDTQYPSAKAVYDFIGDINDLLESRLAGESNGD